MKTAKSTTAATKTKASSNSKRKSSAADGLRELFIESLKDIYWAEKH